MTCNPTLSKMKWESSIDYRNYGKKWRKMLRKGDHNRNWVYE